MPLKKQLTFQPQLSKEWKVVRASIRTQVMLWESITMLLKLIVSSLERENFWLY